MLLFVGLGNPGKQYEMTRHNVGFQIIDTVARSFRFPEFSCKHDVAISIGNVGSHRVMLIKPLTYMNNSGEPVRRIVSMYKVLLDAVTVFHDDIDLRPGVVKVKRGGGSAGHNGIRSLDAAIGNNYWRVRFGVGRTGRDNVSSYVLAAFANLTEVQTAIDALAANISMLLDGNHKEFISKVSVPFKY